MHATVNIYYNPPSVKQFLDAAIFTTLCETISCCNNVDYEYYPVKRFLDAPQADSRGHNASENEYKLIPTDLFGQNRQQQSWIENSVSLLPPKSSEIFTAAPTSFYHLLFTLYLTPARAP